MRRSRRLAVAPGAVLGTVVMTLVSLTSLTSVTAGAAERGKQSPRAAVAPGAVTTAEDGATIRIGAHYRKIQLCAENIVRVAFAASAETLSRPELPARSALATAAKRCTPTPWKPATTASTFTLATAKLKVVVDLATGDVRFLDPAGRIILAERPGGRTLAPAEVQGEQTFHVGQQWERSADEALYGLGQHQQQLMDIKDHDLELRQYNTEIYIPFLVSSRGYGILWDNTSFTRAGDLSAPVPLPNVNGLYAPADKLSQPGDVAIRAGAGTVDWSGSITPPVTGDYLFRTYSAGGIKLQVNNQVVVDHWRQGWLPNEDVARVRLTAGRPVPVRLQWTRDIGVNIVRLLWKPPVVNRATALWSEVGDAVDYTVVFGPDLDRVIAGYRQLTGQASMPPRWAFGFWQSRERYATQQQSLDVLATFRARQFPVDVIVQDWRYWPEGQWGSHAFDSKRFPDPARWAAEIHDRLHAHLMISVWPKFYRGTANFDTLNAAGFLYQPNLSEGKVDFLGKPFSYYDAFNPAARQLYWEQLRKTLFPIKVDGWWMDATEPEVVEGPFKSVAAQVETNRTHMHPTALGSGARMLNAYAVMNSQAIHDGQRAAAPRQRTLILTRNGFAGQQRYGAVSWSGDISSTWTALRKQIPAGLGFSLSGMPYWTQDSGGFSVPGRFASAARGSAELDEWRELNTRWFEYAAFLPIFRVHGQAPRREPWEFGGAESEAFQAQKKFARLRYRLLPYLYGLAGAVTQQGGSILRPLVMDFPGDTVARALDDQYMFGPAFLVNPVTRYKARSRAVYLPRTPGGWYDFWTGRSVAAPTGGGGGGGGAGGSMIEVRAPFDEIPLLVRAGAIVPFGPELQYAEEKPADPLTLLVYSGADGAFTIYDDDGASNDYEAGAFSRIPLRWTEDARTLTIGKREGTFPGMRARRTFNIVLVTAGRPVPFSFSLPPGKTVAYTGEAVTVALP